VALHSCRPSTYTYLLFFFCCYGAHRALHSFPTRRSSDLGSWRGMGLITGLVCRVPGSLPEREPASAILNPSDRRVGATKQRALPDRKSTRLNSSHVKISYAVFCLKKKKITGRETDKTETS